MFVKPNHIGFIPVKICNNYLTLGNIYFATLAEYYLNQCKNAFNKTGLYP